MSRHNRWILCIVVFLAGCGRGEFELAPVSGRVTLNGDPLPKAMVSFEPSTTAAEAGPGSTGETDEQGRFSLTTVDGRRGAVVGDHRVVISTLKYAGNRSDSANVKRDEILAPEKVPTSYSAEGKLTFKVP